MLQLYIHEHALAHGLPEESIRCAWDNFARRRLRGTDFEVRIGFDADSREIGMVGAILDNGDVLVIHAKTPAIPSIRKELGE